MTVHRDNAFIDLGPAEFATEPEGPCAVTQKWTLSPECRAVLQNCFKRIFAWPVPPNWSRSDWFDEIKAHGVAASCQALWDYEVERAVPLQAFIYQRVMARALTRYRQEWRYALHVVSEDAQGDTPMGSESFPAQAGKLQVRVEASSAYGALRDAVASLPKSSRSLIEQLFWHERTEQDVAEVLRIGRRAVNKRKHAVLMCLQRVLTDRSQNKTQDEVSGSKRH
jgi:DNA-directed RNA polymerase specialized sigma24 family protein